MANTTTTTKAAAAQSTRDRIKKLVEQNSKQNMGQSDPNLAQGDPMDPHAKYFTAPRDDNPPEIGMVRLSSLVGDSWKLGRTLDPWVKVFDGLDNVPERDPHYLPNQHALVELAFAFQSPVRCNVWMEGDPSVGKTSLGKFFAAITGRPFHRINFTADDTSDTIFGTQDLKDGNTEYHLGDIPLAMQEDHAIIVFDEPTFCPSEGQTLLQEALEPDGVLKLKNKPGPMQDRVIRWGFDVHNLMCDNTVGTGDSTGMYNNAQQQNRAWLDRVNRFVHVDWLAPADESEMLLGRFPDMTQDLATKIVDVASALRNGFRNEDLSVICSMRVTQSWSEIACQMRNPFKGFELAFLNRLDDKSEREAAKEIFRNHFGVM